MLKTNHLHITDYLKEITVNLKTEGRICISTYSDTDVVTYNSTSWTELNDINVIVEAS